VPFGKLNLNTESNLAQVKIQFGGGDCRWVASTTRLLRESWPR